jgi:hypothetical protein
MGDGKVFKDQTALKLSLHTLINFNNTTPTSAKICYKSPDGEEDEWAATIEADSTVGEIYVNFSDVINFDQAGTWYLWSKLEFSDGRVAYGVTQKYIVREVGVIYN